MGFVSVYLLGRNAAIIIAFVFLFFFPSRTPAQSSTENYVLERAYRVRGAAVLNGTKYWGTPSDVITTISYKDGLGREKQQVVVSGAPNMADWVIQTEYDAVFRPNKEHLPQPQPDATGNFRNTPVANYYSSTSNVTNPTTSPYTETIYDNSPLNRVKEKKSPGIESSNGSRIFYRVGGTGIKHYRFDVAGVLQAAAGDYPSGALQILETWDENDKKVEEFRDRNDRVVARRVGESLITYYVYNQKGLLRYVLQPAYQEEANLDKFAFQYTYDDRGRMKTKKIPGQGMVTMEYDTRDRLINRTDGKGQVFYYKYEDDNNRQKEMGVIDGGVDKPLLYTWYDNYSFTPFAGFNNELALTEAGHFLGTPGSDSKKGLVTGQRTRVLGPDGELTGELLNLVFYYDKKGRLIQTQRQLFGGGSSGTETKSLELDFTGNVITERTTQKINSSGFRLEKSFVFDHQNRLNRISHRFYKSDDGGGNYVEKKNYMHLANTYNMVGFPEEKKLHNDIQKISYRYRPNGWLSTVGNNGGKRFELDLGYANNGNITNLAWKTAGYAGSFNTIEYDFANRLTKAEGAEYTENNILYDPNGNIKTLWRRKGQADIDKLVYTYDGGRSNLLKKVEDSMNNSEGFDNGGSGSNDDYAYDGNGNLTKDANRGITGINYNVLNLPGMISGRNVQYTYDGLGNKLKTDAPSGATRFYAGNFEYGANNALMRIGLEEGQLVSNSNGEYEVHYYLKDHLGNVRMVLKEDGTVLQETEYYPFGLAIPKSGTDAINRYQYNGKEKQPETGYLDYGARMYDPSIGRWGTVDPMAEKYYSYSSYAYAINDPVLFRDIDGRDIDVSRFKSKEEKEILAQFLSTRTGYEFFSQFANKGDKVGDVVFNSTGERAKDLLVVQSTDHENMWDNDGLTQTFERKDPSNNSEHPSTSYGKELQSADKNTNIGNGVIHLIRVHKDLSKTYKLRTLAHEAFVHVQEDVNRLRALESNGRIKPGTQEYIDKLQFTGRSGNIDHQKLSRGQITDYLNISAQLDKLKNTNVYTELYNQDVRNHGKK